MSAVEVLLTSTTCAALPRLLIRTYPPLVGANWYCWARVALQAYCWTTVPFAVAAERASTHLELPLLTALYQAVGEMPPGSGGVVPEPPPSQSRPSRRNLFWTSLSNVEDRPVLVS